MTDKRLDGGSAVPEEEHLGAPQLEALQVLGDICGQGAKAISLPPFPEHYCMHVHLTRLSILREKEQFWNGTGLGGKLGSLPSL